MTFGSVNFLKKSFRSVRIRALEFEVVFVYVFIFNDVINSKSTYFVDVYGPYVARSMAVFMHLHIFVKTNLV